MHSLRLTGRFGAKIAITEVPDTRNYVELLVNARIYCGSDDLHLRESVGDCMHSWNRCISQQLLNLCEQEYRNASTIHNDSIKRVQSKSLLSWTACN